MTCRAWILAALLLAAPAWSQEDVLPDDENNSTHFGDSTGAGCAPLCNAKNCATDVDDDPFSLDGAVNRQGTNPGTIIYTFASPSGDVSAGTDAQTIEIALSKSTTACAASATGGDPTYDLDIYCNGVQKISLATAASWASSPHSYTWTFASDGDCSASGATVEVRVIGHQAGGGPNRRNLTIGAVRWVATIAGAADELMVIGR